MGNRITLSVFKERLFDKFGDLVCVDGDSYVNMITKCRFIDKDYGEFFGIPDNVFRGKNNHSERKKLNRKQTNIERFGVDVPLKNKLILEKVKQTNLERFGVEFPVQNEEIKEKMKQTNLEKYGTECSLNNDSVRQKRQETWDEKYDGGNPLSDKNVRKGIMNTNIEKYGFDYPMKNKEIAQRAAKSQNNSTVLYHWKTGKEVVCVGSFERATVEDFNNRKEDFIWQMPFKMPNGKVYIVDCYLPERNIFVEIKGYFRKDAQEKWEWFCKEHSNSELWNKKKLKELGIL